MENIVITPEDADKVLSANPVFTLQVKCMALIRMIEERDAEIARLVAELATANEERAE